MNFPCPSCFVFTKFLHGTSQKSKEKCCQYTANVDLPNSELHLTYCGKVGSSSAGIR